MGVIQPIDPKLLDWFINRELDNFDGIKEVSEEELDARLQALSPNPPIFHTVPFKHQKAMFLLGVDNPQFCFFADMGLGKSAITLNLIAYLKQCGKLKKALILVPNLILIQNWLDEVAKHTPQLKAVPVHGTKAERLELLASDADVYILNYTGLHVILDHGTKRKREISPADVTDFASNFDFVAYDELTAVKNPLSITFKICDQLSQVVPYKYGLTGRPFGRDPLDLWAQFHVIDGGQTLGKNYFFFRSAFFKPRKRRWGIDWKFNSAMTEPLAKLLKNKSIRYKSEDLKLEPVYAPLRIPFPEEYLAYIGSINDELEASILSHKTEKIRSNFIQLREISSGFLNFKDEDKETQQIVFIEQPKIELLLQKIDEIPEDSKVIIFHDFTFSGQQISKALKAKDIPFRWIYGGTPDKLKLEALREFKFNPEMRVLVLNSASGALGLNLQIANYCIFYESPVDPIIREQAERRIARTGQTKTCFIYDIIMIYSNDSKHESVDERILGFIAEGENMLTALIENKGARK